MQKYSEYDYMYASAKIAAVSGKLASPSKLRALCDCRDISEFSDRISELGLKPVSDETGFNPELTLNCWLSGEYAALLSYLPDPKPVYTMRSRYDCHNVKTAIKCRYLGIDPGKIFIDCGNVTADACVDMAASHDFSKLSPALAAAAQKADKMLDESKDARQVDVILDKACFAEMQSYVEGLGFAPASGLFRLKIDMTNIMSVLRTLKLKSKAKAKMILKDSLIPGGNLKTEALSAVNSPDELIGLTEGYPDVKLADLLKKGLPEGSDGVFALFEKEFLYRTREICSKTQLGAGPIADYIISLEYQVKNLRIIFSGISCGTDPDTLRERLRV